MNIVIPYKAFNNYYNWNILYIDNTENDFFKINYSDLNCIIENIYVRIPNPISNYNEFQEFLKIFDEFKTTIFNRCCIVLPKKPYILKSSNNIDENNSPKIIKIINIKLNDNVIYFNYDNIY